MSALNKKINKIGALLLVVLTCTLLTGCQNPFGKLSNNEEKYTINYVLNGGVNSEDVMTSFTAKSADITLPTDVNRDGYIFDGWFTNSEFSEDSKLSIIAKGTTGDVTLYAKRLDVFIYSDDTRTEIVGSTKIAEEITTVKIPEGVKKISKSCDFRKLMSITIPSTVTSLDGSSWSYRLVEIYNLSNLEILPGEDGISKYAKVIHKSAKEKSNLKVSNGVVYFINGEEKIAIAPADYSAESVKFDSDCTSINGFAFYVFGAIDYCFRDDVLTSITIPEGVESIGESAFSGCSKITSVTIPSSVTSIERAAFNCSRLTEIYNFSKLNITAGSSENGAVAINAKVVHTSSKDKTNLKNSNNVVYYISGEEKIAIAPIDYNVGELALDSDCTSVEAGAFGDSVNFTSIRIPSSVTSIGENAFRACYRLAEVYNFSELNITSGSSDNGCVALYAKVVHTTDDASKLVKSNGVVYYKDNSDTIAIAPTTYSASTITISSDCEEINGFAFFFCEKLKSVTFSAKISSIGSYAFGLCSGLKNITIPKKVTKIDAATFMMCTNLESIVIPEGVTSIEEMAFYNTNLASVTIPASVESVGPGAFYGSSLKEVTIPSSVTSIGKYAFRNCWNLKNITFDKDVNLNSFGYGVFFNCTSLTKITVPNGVSYIEGTFANCSGLKSVVIPSSVTSINEYTFQDCSNLEIVYYGGATVDDWNAITIGSESNEYLTNSTIYYYSETEPTDDSNKYWHYDENNNVVVW